MRYELVICINCHTRVNLCEASTERPREFWFTTRGCAPLAQSAERFHGKEKVDSSILSGGSVLLSGIVQVEEWGGVAQW